MTFAKPYLAFFRMLTRHWSRRYLQLYTLLSKIVTKDAEFQEVCGLPPPIMPREMKSRICSDSCVRVAVGECA